jgi:hypothetical protein
MEYKKDSPTFREGNLCAFGQPARQKKASYNLHPWSSAPVLGNLSPDLLSRWEMAIYLLVGVAAVCLD